jgi:single-strand DNA-binding protein
MKMNDVNQVTITGRLARKPEVRTTPSGVAVADIVVANHRWMKAGGEKTAFVRCALWNKQAEYAGKKLDVGDQVLVNGQIVDDNYTPKGAEKSTAGRLKLDNCRIQIIAKSNGTKAESTDAPAAEPEDDAGQDPIQD